MKHYVGIDVSLDLSSVCVVDATGKVVREAKVPSEPAALVRFLHDLGLELERVGLEAGPLSQWLQAGLTEAGGGGRGTAGDPARQGSALGDDGQDRPRGRPRHRPAAPYGLVPARTPQGARRPGGPALLAGRKLRQAKLRDVELSIRGILRGFGLKIGEVSKGRFEGRVRALVAGHERLEVVIGAMLKAREGLQAEFMHLHRRMLAIVRADTVCRRLMTVPGVGASVSLTFKAAVDDPGRFTSSQAVGAHFGLTPKKDQSGQGSRMRPIHS